MTKKMNRTLRVLLGLALFASATLSPSSRARSERTPAPARAESETLRTITPGTFPDYDAATLDRIARTKSAIDASKNGYFANPELAKLFSSCELEVDASDRRATIPFRLYVPKLQAGKRYPLIVVWHGQGESDDDNSSQLAHLQYGIESFYRPRALDAFVLAPQCPRDAKDWFSSENRFGVAPLEYSLALIRAVIESYPIDPDRVSALGICSGAGAMLNAQLRSPGLFCAMASCSYFVGDYEATALTVPYWSFGNVDDRSAPIEQLRRTIRSIRRRVPRLLTESRGGHDSWTNALRNEQVLAWLARQRRGDYLAPPPGARISVDRSFRACAAYYAVPLLLLAALFGLVEPRVRRALRACD